VQNVKRQSGNNTLNLDYGTNLLSSVGMLIVPRSKSHLKLSPKKVDTRSVLIKC
jgi:hypothetical protein